MAKKNSFSQFDGAEGSEAARRGKVAEKSPKAPTSGAKSSSGGGGRRADQGITEDKVRSDMKEHRRRVLRGGSDR